MKKKTAKRFLARNSWRMTKYMMEVSYQIRDIVPRAFGKRWKEAVRSMLQL